ncbi:hypothetical protein GOV12_05285 [Candidatus Pacearchaeota archaeon]|nr:hypothetical protein [Candidatus Pacearchaeota archaeon]
MKDFEKSIIPGITSFNGKGWKRKLMEVEKLGITRVGLFLEEIDSRNNNELFDLLLKSNIKEIPLVHIKESTTCEDINFLIKNFKSKYFTIHESDFKNLEKWKSLYKKLFLEMNFDDYVSKNVKVKKIGGFCIDLSHFKASWDLITDDFKYVIERKNFKKYFKCNHLNGYSYKENRDLHRINSLKNFDYLKSLPSFIFGDVIALEMYNSISEQLKFKKYIVKMLG